MIPATTPRSWLYVPGTAQGKLAKAAGVGADALIVDLEDAVPSGQKPAARALVHEWLQELDVGRVQVWVRVNAGPERMKDLEAVATAARLTGLVAAKIEAPQDLDAVDAELSGRGVGHLPVIPLLESGAAILDALQIARHRRALRLQVGEFDLMADLGVLDTAQDEALTTSRNLVVLASAAAGIAPPIAPVSRDFRDEMAFRTTTQRLRAGGYVGRACIHPAQVSIANEVFTPTAEELDRARDVVARAASADGAVTVDAEGQMVDFAVVRQAQRLLSLVT